MKKILTTALAIIVAALALTGCNNNSTSGNSSSTNQSSNNSTDNSSSNNSGSSSDESTSSGGDSPSVSTNGKAKFMVETALAFKPDEWSGMMNEVTDPETLSVLFPDIDISLCEDYCFMVDMTGINKHEVLVAKAKPGNEGAVKVAFDAYLESLKSPDAMLYPAGQEAVAGAVSGITADSYNYVIIHPNGENIAAAMTSEK